MAKGLLSTGPKVGTRVLPHEHWNWLDPDVLSWQFRVGLTSEFLHCVSELRRLVEPPSLRLAALRATAEQLAEIERAFQRMQQAVAQGLDDLSDDLDFHHLLLKASGNRLLVQMSKLLRALLRAGFDRLGRRPAVPDASLPWHAEVLQALQARDAERAQRAMAALIDAVDEDLGLFLRQQAAGGQPVPG
jgi:DNA-binding FadR family transcriptional regulator